MMLKLKLRRDSDVMYFETSAVLITVVLLGKFLETYARGVTASAIQGLSKLRARSARLVIPAHQPQDQEGADVAMICSLVHVPLIILFFDSELGLSMDESDETRGERMNPLLNQHGTVTVRHARKRFLFRCFFSTILLYATAATIKTTNVTCNYYEYCGCSSYSV